MAVEQLRGLTAVALSEDPGACGVDTRKDCGLAGGYRQMWVWRDGSFETGWDTAPSPSSDADAAIIDPESFRFRVRDVQFIEDHQLGTKAFAVTMKAPAL